MDLALSCIFLMFLVDGLYWNLTICLGNEMISSYVVALMFFGYSSSYRYEGFLFMSGFWFPALSIGLYDLMVLT